MTSELTFEEFVQILKLYLDDNFDFGDRMDLAMAQDAALEVRALIKDFKPDGHPTLEEFCELCLFFLKKAKDRKFVRFTKLKNFDFYYFLEEAMNSESDQFKHYMMYLKKNQGFVIPEDFMKILTRFKVLSLPFARDLDLNPTSSRSP